MLRRFRLIVACAAAGLAAACASTPPAVRPASAPPSEAVVAIDILHQDVTISPFAEADVLTGEQTMVFRASTAGDRLRFTGGPLRIATLSLDGRPLEDWSTSGDAVEIRLGQTLDADGRHSLRLTYQAAPGRGVRRSEDLAYSTYFACDWMLCNQADFADRFTFELAIRAPVGMRTLGPGTELGVTHDGEDELHRWRTTEPFPAYVHGFLAGNLRSHDVTNGCVARLDVLSAAPAEQVAALFGPTCAMLEYFESRAGVPIPADRYSQLHLPDAWEAQEAISHSTLGGGAVTPMLSDPAEDWAVAHELAHQWWGNRVTATDLSQFWLNEGIVTFMVASWKEHRWGEAAYQREIELARSRWMRCRSEWRDVPLAYGGDYPSLATRRCFQYSKAAVFVHELRTRMGEGPLWRGMAAFTTAHFGRSVTSRDFEAAMQSATRIDLQPLFAEWVHPTVP